MERMPLDVADSTRVTEHGSYIAFLTIDAKYVPGRRAT